MEPIYKENKAMKICKQCQSQMQEGCILKANTYGKISIVVATPKKDDIKVAICPSCGEITLSVEKNT